MPGTCPIILQLVNKDCHSKALLKYETKQLEVRLKRIMGFLSMLAKKEEVREKPALMWLDAIFQSAVNSCPPNAAKHIITSHKRDTAQVTNRKIEQLFNAIEAQQASFFCGKNLEAD
jgi:hypothetical protein